MPTTPRYTSHITFRPVTDLAASRDFYERDLGLRVVRDQGACLILEVSAGAHIGLCQAGYDGRTEPLLQDDRWITTLVTDDVEGVHARLLQMAAEVSGPPRHNDRFGITHFFVRDPDGYRVEIQRFDDPLA